MTDPTKPTDAMVAAGRQALIAAAIVDVMMGGDTSWRSRIDESEFLESADWAMAVAYANAAISALEPADSDGDGDAEWLRSRVDWGVMAPDDVDRLNRIATRLEQGELVEALRPFARCPARGKTGGRFVIAKAIYADDDQTPREAHWHWSDFEKAVAALARADAPVGDANHD